MSSPCPYAYSLVANALELLATAEKSSRETEERLRKSRKAEDRARVAVEDEEKREERAFAKARSEVVRCPQLVV